MLIYIYIYAHGRTIMARTWMRKHPNLGHWLLREHSSFVALESSPLASAFTEGNSTVPNDRKLGPDRSYIAGTSPSTFPSCQTWFTTVVLSGS